MTNYTPNSWTAGDIITEAKMDRLEAAVASHTHAAVDIVPGAAIALTDAATIATNAALGTYFRVTLTGNRTLGAPTNLSDGMVLTWEFIQDATGSRTLALNSIFALGTTIISTTLTTTASKRDFLTARYNSTANKLYVTDFTKGY